MARSEARIAVAIWSDEHFTSLGPGAQRMFMFLLSQPDLAHDGVIALRERRWSKAAAGLTRADIERDLCDLAAAKFIVVDEDAEELLIRSFIRGDKVYRQPNVLRAAQDHLEIVTSPTIRAAIGVELRRIIASGELKGESIRIVDEMLAAIGNPSGKGSGNPSPNPSAQGSGNPPEDVPDSAVVNTSNPSRPTPAAEDPAAQAKESRQPAQADTSTAETAVFAGGNPSAKGSGNPSPNPSGNPSAATPGERGVVTAVGSGSPFPDSPCPVPPPTAARSGEPEPDDAIEGELLGHQVPALVLVTDLQPQPAQQENAGQINSAWIDHCTSRNVKLTTSVIKRYGAGIKRALADGFTTDMVKRALGEMLHDRVASRPALLDNYLIRIQQGPELPPRRATQGEAAAARMSPSGSDLGALIHDALTRPA
ncbi:hypothetical protein ABT297_04165 [Dactylosporangium sp. NPDC000555]|uniref:hypothetical protein n=1 Tax=Dactylosporangium sp. NPDC000555 TaxID=3154260 RepID=UPI00332D059C